MYLCVSYECLVTAKVRRDCPELELWHVASYYVGAETKPMSSARETYVLINSNPKNIHVQNLLVDQIFKRSKDSLSLSVCTHSKACVYLSIPGIKCMKLWLNKAVYCWGT